MATDEEFADHFILVDGTSVDPAHCEQGPDGTWWHKDRIRRVNVREDGTPVTVATRNQPRFNQVTREPEERADPQGIGAQHAELTRVLPREGQAPQAQRRSQGHPDQQSEQRRQRDAEANPAAQRGEARADNRSVPPKTV